MAKYFLTPGGFFLSIIPDAEVVNPPYGSYTSDRTDLIGYSLVDGVPKLVTYAPPPKPRYYFFRGSPLFTVALTLAVKDLETMLLFILAMDDSELTTTLPVNVSKLRDHLIRTNPTITIPEVNSKEATIT